MMEEALESILPGNHRLLSNVFSPQSLEGCRAYFNSKKEKTDTVNQKLAWLYINLHTKTVGLNILNPDHIDGYVFVY